MNIYRINALPIAELADALQVFEQQFTYPLGKDCFFRIEHGVDYARFYRSIGTACCFVAKHNDQVLAVMSVAIRPLLCPDGSEQTVCYLGDLKIAPAARGGRLLVQLQQAIRDWLPSPDMPSFGVVMEGSRKIPSEYSGRAGIPAFTAVGKTIIMRIACEHPAQGVPHFLSNEAAVRDGYRRLSKGRYASPVGDPATRSLMTPIWLMTTNSTACGCLEDTRGAKRLVTNDNAEIMSAHLSCFAFSNVADGAALIRTACEQVASLNYPALFVSVAAADVPSLSAALGKIKVVYAPATIFAQGIATGSDWNINCSEI